MIKYIIKRILLMAVTLFIILSLTYILLNLLPLRIVGNNDQKLAFYNDLVQKGFYYTITLGKDVSELPPDAAFIYYGKTVIGYYRYSSFQQYFTWLENVFTKWDWGASTSLQIGSSAWDYIFSRMPVTISINVITMFIAVPIGFILGIVAALKKNKAADHVISTGVMIFISVPSFVFITFLILIFCYQFRVLPSTWPLTLDSTANRIKGYIIPVFALSLGTICGFARYTRAELCDIMSSEFLLLARTKGLTKRQTVVRHGLRNVMVPIIPMIIGEFVGILTGAMIIEQLYGIPGVGQLFVKAIAGKDYNVLMVDMAFYTAIGLFASLIVDLSYGIIDPRIRMGAR